MATKPSTAVEKTLQKIQDQITCGICLEPYKQPKLLKCFHMFCEQCLQHLARGERGKQNISCPNCRQDTPLPVGGVLGLQRAFYLETLLEIKDTLKNSPDHCPNHDKEADFYCEQCEELLCSYCLIPAHRDHQYDLLSNVFVKQDKVIVDSLKPIKDNIAGLERAVELVDTRCAAVVQQKAVVVEEIHTTIAHLRQALQAKETELVGQVEHITLKKLCILGAQRDKLELKLGQLRSFQDFVEESRRTCSQGEILSMKTPLLKQMNDLKGSIKAERMTLAEQADMRFVHNLPKVQKAFQQFGKVYCNPVCPKKCTASGEGIGVAIRGKKTTVSVEAFDGEGEAYFKPITDSLECELVAKDGSSRVEGTMSIRNQTIYDISYQPQVTGQHQLHILMENRPISHSPFTVNVLPNLTVPAKIISDLKGPWGIAVRERGEVVVAKHESGCVSIISHSGKRKSFGTYGSSVAQFNGPAGVAVDSGGNNIIVVDSKNHRIQQWSSTGKHIRTVGTRGQGCLHFKYPTGVAIHPHTNKVYVADYGNHRVQVLNPDLTASSAIGKYGSSDGSLKWPYDVSMDRDGNLYVADSENHRIQVFTASGVYLNQFGRNGKGKGELNLPASIAIDSNNVVYVGEWGNNRVSIFSTEGDFIKFFGEQGNGPCQFISPYGVAVDKKGAVYVSDTDNNRIQKFT